jgi:hypothetical protein
MPQGPQGNRRFWPYTTAARKSHCARCMCGKPGSVCGSKNKLDNLDPQSLIDRLLNDDERRRWLNEDPGRPGQVLDPNSPPDPRRDPNAGGQNNDPDPPTFPRDPRQPGQETQPRDPGGPGNNRPPVDPVGLHQPLPVDPKTGGSYLPPRDTYTGGRVSGLASTEPVRDPIGRSNALPSGSMLTKNDAIDYLSVRRGDLASALRTA